MLKKGIFKKSMEWYNISSKYMLIFKLHNSVVCIGNSVTKQTFKPSILNIWCPFLGSEMQWALTKYEEVYSNNRQG